MIVAIFFGRVTFPLRVAKSGSLMGPSSIPATVSLPALKPVSPARKLSLRGRAWCTFIPPWPNDGMPRLRNLRRPPPKG